MSREKELVKNTAVLSIGKLLPKLTSFITLPILTAYLTKAEYGTYDLISTLIMLVIPIATLQIQSAAFRFLIDCREDKKRSSEIISSIFVVTLPITLLTSVTIQFFFYSFSGHMRVLISTYFFLDTIYLTVGQAARGLGNNKVFSIGSIILSITYMFAIVVGVCLSKTGLLGVMIALVIAQIIGASYIIISVDLMSYLSIHNISIDKIKMMLSYSWPLIPNNLSAWILKLSDRLVITGFLGLEANAAYAVANKIPSLLVIAQNLLVMAWQENASMAVKDTDVEQYFSKMLDRVYSLMFGGTILLIGFTPVIFNIFIKGDYQSAYYQMPVLILGMFFLVMSSFVGGIYVAHKRTISGGVSTMIAAVINLAIDLCCVSFLGIWAGSISTLVAYVFLYLYRIIDIQRFQKLFVNKKKQFLLVFIMIIMLVLCFMRRVYLDIINICIGLGVFFYINREFVHSSIKYSIKLIKKKKR